MFGRTSILLLEKVVIEKTKPKRIDEAASPIKKYINVIDSSSKLTARQYIVFKVEERPKAHKIRGRNKN